MPAAVGPAFQEIGPDFYQVTPIGGEPRTCTYFLRRTGPPAPTTPAGGGLPAGGMYVFTNDPVPSAGAADFAARLRGHPVLAGRVPLTDALIWVADLAAVQSALAVKLEQVGDRLVRHDRPQFRVLEPAGLDLPGSLLSFTIPRDAIVSQAVELPALQILAQGGPDWRGLLTYGDEDEVLFSAADGLRITLPLAGPAAGCLCFRAAVDPGNLFRTFRCGFLYAAESGVQFFPMIPPVTADSDDPMVFDIRLHPTRPLDAAATSFSFAESGSELRGVRTTAAPIAPYFFNRAGAPTSLRPVAPPRETADLPGSSIGGGFAFSRGPGGLYLSPAGLWAVDGPADQFVDVMPGLSGEEFLRLKSGDCVEFVPDCPAHAVPAGASAASSPLDASCSTSWLRLKATADAGRGYFGQPSAASAFASGAGTSFSSPLEVRLATIEEAGSARFPVAPYGGITIVPPLRAGYKPAESLPPGLLPRLEATVLAGMRHEILAKSPQGPVFAERGAVAPSPALLDAATAQGILFALNADGTVGAVTLAVAPSYPGASPPRSPTRLRFAGVGAPPRVPALLGNALMRDQLFLVISALPPNPPAWGFTEDALFLAGFEFLHDIGTGTILICKFNTQSSLADLAASPSVWADGAAFNRDPSATAQDILQAIKEAKQLAGAPGDPFHAFNALAADAGWTGIIALNVQIDGNAMPPDLQMLLGGIKGDLRAHHLGTQANRVVSAGSPPRLSIEQSSLFGVIHYDGSDAAPAPPAPELDYEVEALTIVFSNAKIVQFDVRVGVTIGTLFGRAVSLTSPLPPAPIPPNTLTIQGQYHEVAGIGTVTFDVHTPFSYSFPTQASRARVLDKCLLTEASLSPVSSTVQPGGTAILARLSLDGELWFNPAPFPNASGVDLFSYGMSGSDGGGMAFTGLAIDIRFTLDPASGSMKPGSKDLSLQAQMLKPAPAWKTIRRGSLLHSLPLQLSGFSYDAGGIAASGATPVRCAELEVTRSPTDSSSSTLDAHPPPTWTAAPVYALEYDIHLGSLGALSDAHAGLAAKLLLGWGPSPVSPEDDAAAVLVQLPQLSAGVSGFALEGLLKTTFGDANLLKLELPQGSVYAILFSNVQLSIFGFGFPPGYLVDFVLFAGETSDGAPTSTNNLAWYLAAEPSA